ncbi:MAG: 5-carboxymethyl-2-hydroxymuconate semialdehyde dehydrogenase, partial [Actinomycetota bacterium]|nr:5-carboxymethyl-2-hydroxymuconate semialdehyde dehydrogenase [Actinomycetota bacterium]
MAADKTFEQYEQIASASVGRVTAEPVFHLIGGQRVANVDGATFTNSSPVDGSALATVASGDAADVDAAA